MSDERDKPEARRERLEVPSSTALERRLLVGDALPRRPRHKPTIKPVPPSGLLGRLQAFLPTLEAANADLQQQLDAGGGEQVAMERGSDDEREGPYVEMDLACGLFDLKDPAAVAAAEAAMAHRGVAVEAYGAGSSDDSSDDSSDGDSNVSNEGQEGEDEEERLRQALGIVAAAQHPQQQERQPLGQQREGSAPAASAGDDAMEEDAPARQLSPVAAAAGPAAGMEDGAAAGAPPGRRRKHKGRRHAGIEELS